MMPNTKNMNRRLFVKDIYGETINDILYLVIAFQSYYGIMNMMSPNTIIEITSSFTL
jgi:hypothetical protein